MCIRDRSRMVWVRLIMAGLALMPMRTRNALSSASPALSMMESSLVMTRTSAWVMALDANRRPRREGFDTWSVAAGARLSAAPASLICSGVRPWTRSWCMAWARLAACKWPSTICASARAAFQTKLDIAVVLRHTQQLIQTGGTGSDLEEAVFIQSVHARGGSFGMQGRGVESVQDAATHTVVNDEQLVDATAPVIACLTAMLATHRFEELRRVQPETLQPTTHQQRWLRFVGLFALPAQAPYKPLRDHAVNRRCDEVRLNAHVL